MNMLSTIYILWIRQLKRYVRSRARMISALAQPLLFLVAFGFGFGPIYAAAGEGDYINFLAPGIIAMTVIFTAMFNGIELIWDRQFGFLKETLVAPVSRFSILLGRTLGGATVATIQGCIVFLITLLMGFRPNNWALLPLALLLIFLTSLLFTTFGTIVASFLEDMQAFPLIMNFLVMPLFFLSGALFPLEGLPKGVALVSYFNPLSYGVDGLRGILGASSHFGLIIDFLVITFIIAVLFVIGSYRFERLEA